MKIISEHGNKELAMVYVAQMREEDEYMVEFAESIQPPVPREEKWVLIISSLFGCPVRCRMCDAGGSYHGKLETEEMLEQIHYLIKTRFPDGQVNIPKFKIQFARMGEPALNRNVLEALRVLPERFDAPGLMPCISTVAPAGAWPFFEELIEIKDELYPDGRFQLQFSIHTTDDELRNELMPINKMTLVRIADFGERFVKTGDRKVTLNFAMAEGYPVSPDRIADIFDPEKFLIKLTPINPTNSATKNELASVIENADKISEPVKKLIAGFESLGFEVLLSIGELEENQIGSNCGMYISK
ncbi:MAG: radical SAM protein [Thermoplasmata archaeon]|nr:radical SAM protein [Thermoplasmata archaeon]